MTSRTTGGKAPSPRLAHSRAPLSALESHRGQGHSEPLPHGGVTWGVGPPSRDSFVLWKLLAHGGRRSLLAPARGPAGCREAHPAPPKPPSIPGYWHTPASIHRGRGHGPPSQLCPCHPGQAPLPPRASISLSVTKGQRCGAPLLGFTRRLETAHRVCSPTVGLSGRRCPLLTLHMISRPQTATLVPAASCLTAIGPARAGPEWTELWAGPGAGGSEPPAGTPPSAKLRAQTHGTQRPRGAQPCLVHARLQHPT